MNKPTPYQAPVLEQVEWAIRMFKESKTPEAVDVPLLLARVRDHVELLERKARDWNTEADKYLGQRDELAVKLPAWHPVETVQPEDGQYCLVWCKWPGRMAVHMFQRRQRPAWTWEGLYGWEPTHWMALPDPPA